MAIDPRIALGVQPVQIQSPVQSYTQALTLKDLMGQQEMRALQMQQARDANQRAIGLRQLMADPTLKTPEQRAARLREGGYWQEADEAEKAGVEIGYKRSQIDKNQVEAGLRKIERLNQLVSVAQDQDTYSRALMRFRAEFPGSDRLLLSLPAQFSPEAVLGIQKELAVAKDGITAILPKITMQDVGGEIRPVDTSPFTNPNPQAITKTQTPGDVQRAKDAAASRAISAGQLQVARDRLEFDRSAPRGIPTQTPDGIMLVDPRGGPSRPAIGPDGKPLRAMPTEGQSNANLYANRMIEADAQLRPLETEINLTGLAAKQGAEGLPLVGGVAGYAGNAMISGSQQQVDQAQRNFINAVLRRESGAVINPDEFANARKQYFPQPGDSEEVIEQKRKNRETAIAGIRQAAGPAFVEPSPPPSIPGGASGSWGEGWSIKEVK